MKTEKLVRQQARDSLKGNHTILMASVGLIFLTYLLLFFLRQILMIMTGEINIYTGEADTGFMKMGWFISIGYVSALFLVSPLINGFLHASANAALKNSCSTLDLFYYFGSVTRYFKTLVIKMLVFLLFAVSTSALDLEKYFRVFFKEQVPGSLGFDPDSFMIIFVGVITILIRILLYLFFVHFPLTAYAFNEDLGVSKCVFVMMGFSAKNFWKTFRLLISFSGWLLLCFFVVPALYVIPYVSVSALTSAKWLFQLDERRCVI